MKNTNKSPTSHAENRKIMTDIRKRKKQGQRVRLDQKQVTLELERVAKEINFVAENSNNPDATALIFILSLINENANWMEVMDEAIDLQLGSVRDAENAELSGGVH